MTSIPIRRIVTAQRPNGANVVAIDEVVEPLVHSSSGMAYWPIYGRDEVTRLPHDAPMDYPMSFFPSTSAGFRMHVVEFPARSGSAYQPGSGEWPTRGLAEGRYAEPDSVGMHWTDTIDLIVVLSGEIGLVHDDGHEVVLQQGNIVVQNGAVHAWRPRDVSCQLCFVNLGAEREGAPPLDDSGAVATKELSS
jgi:hypothetical protein